MRGATQTQLAAPDPEDMRITLVSPFDFALPERHFEFFGRNSPQRNQPLDKPISYGGSAFREKPYSEQPTVTEPLVRSIDTLHPCRP
jgi:hypothetical protein